MRKITINGKTYLYQIGRSHLVVREVGVIDFSKLLKMSWDDVERGLRKKTLKITPKHVRDYIQSVKMEKAFGKR